MRTVGILILSLGITAAPAWSGTLDCAPPSDPPANEVYVSPFGRNIWSGAAKNPAPDGSDGPLASIEAARDLIRASGGSGRIVLAGGEYHLSSQIDFDERDAGIELMAAPGERPTLIGGPVVTGWRERTPGLWVAEVPPEIGTKIRDIFVNGRKQTRARYPNRGRDSEVREGWLFAGRPGQGEEDKGNKQFRFRHNDVPRIAAIEGLRVNIVGGVVPGVQWGNDELPVRAIDYGQKIVHTEGTSYFFTGEGSRYFLEGRPEFLDTPGEWHYDARTAELRFRTEDPEFGQAQVVAAILPTFLTFSDTDGATIRGLTLRYGAPEGSGKYGTEMRGYGAIRTDRSDRLLITGNEFSDLGVALHVQQGSNVSIIGNHISRVAGNAIFLGTAYGSFIPAHNARISDNHIDHIGEVYSETAGIWFQGARNLKINNNFVENSAQFGIAGGSLWGGEDASYDVLIADNIVRNSNLATGDGGGIKFMGAQGDPQRSVIRGNIVTGTDALMNRPNGTFWPSGFEDILEWPSPISWAIYLDGRASGIRIENNILTGNVTAIGINGGWSNQVTGNLVAENSGSVLRIHDATGRGWRPYWARPNVVTGNDFTINRSDGRAVDIYAPDHSEGYILLDANRYAGNLTPQSFHILPQIMASGAFGSLFDLRAAGFETSDSPRVPASRQEGKGPRAKCERSND